jgi:hypothetical protein
MIHANALTELTWKKQRDQKTGGNVSARTLAAFQHFHFKIIQAL